MHTCIPSHGLKSSWRSCPRQVNAGNKNTPSTHHPRRRNVTTLMVGLKKTVTYAKISPKSGEPQRYSLVFYEKNVSRTGLCLDAYESISFKLAIIVDMTELYDLRPVEIILTCTQGHRVKRKPNSMVNMDRLSIWRLFFSGASVCMFMSVYVCTCVCAFACFVSVGMCTHACSMCVYMFVCVCIRVCVCVCVCVCVNYYSVFEWHRDMQTVRLFFSKFLSEATF